jgi:hypothetical protein
VAVVERTNAGSQSRDRVIYAESMHMPGADRKMGDVIPPIPWKGTG